MRALNERFPALDRTVRSDAASWGIPPRLAWPLIVLPLAVAAAVALAAPFPPVFRFLMDEDRFIEWAQVLAVSLGAVAFVIATWRAYRSGRRLLALVFALVALSCLVVAGEEISWGQRVLGVATPDVLKEINRQGETNVHNIFGIQRLFNLAELLGGLYGFAVPIIVAVLAGRGRPVRIERLLVPPICLASLFFLPFAYRAVRALLLPEAGERITQYGELPELTLYIGVMLCGVLIARALGRPASAGAA